MCSAIKFPLDVFTQSTIEYFIPSSLVKSEIDTFVNDPRKLFSHIERVSKNLWIWCRVRLSRLMNNFCLFWIFLLVHERISSSPREIFSDFVVGFRCLSVKIFIKSKYLSRNCFLSLWRWFSGVFMTKRHWRTRPLSLKSTRANRRW